MFSPVKAIRLGYRKMASFKSICPKRYEIMRDQTTKMGSEFTERKRIGRIIASFESRNLKELK